MASQQELDNLILQEITTLQVKTALSELQGKAILLHDPTTGAATAFDAYTLFNALGTISLPDISRRISTIEATLPSEVAEEGVGNVVTGLSLSGTTIVAARNIKVVNSENLSIADYNSRLSAGTLLSGCVYIVYENNTFANVMRVCVGDIPVLVRDSQSSFVPITQQSQTVLDALPVDETLSKSGGVLSVVGGGGGGGEALSIARSAYAMAEGVGTWLSESRMLSTAISEVPVTMRRPAFIVNFRPLQDVVYHIKIDSVTVGEGHYVGLTFTAPDGYQTSFDADALEGDSVADVTARLRDEIDREHIGQNGEWVIQCGTATADGFDININSLTDVMTITVASGSDGLVTIAAIEGYEPGTTLSYQYHRDIYNEATWALVGSWRRVPKGQTWKVIN